MTSLLEGHYNFLPVLLIRSYHGILNSLCIVFPVAITETVNDSMISHLQNLYDISAVKRSIIGHLCYMQAMNLTRKLD